eukprot:356031-Chlamydomonas_euryale.AAC.12
MTGCRWLEQRRSEQRLQSYTKSGNIARRPAPGGRTSHLTSTHGQVIKQETAQRTPSASSCTHGAGGFVAASLAMARSAPPYQARRRSPTGRVELFIQGGSPGGCGTPAVGPRPASRDPLRTRCRTRGPSCAPAARRLPDARPVRGPAQDRRHPTRGLAEPVLQPARILTAQRQPATGLS